ncbi:hypothetical protein ABH310_25620 [Chromobacterium piscinae]
MYDSSGKLNVSQFKLVLAEVKKSAEKLTAKESDKRKISKIIDEIVDNPDLLPKKQYAALKKLSHNIRQMRNTEKYNQIKLLSAAVLQMARTHNFQNGMEHYDDTGTQATEKLLKSNTGLETRSNAFVSDTASLEVNGGVKLGLAAGGANGASLTTHLGVGFSKSEMVTNATDTGNLAITRGKGAVMLSARADVGKLASMASLGEAKLEVGANGIRGALFEGRKVKEVVNYRVMHRREGGPWLTRSLAPDKRELKSMANQPTRGLFGKISAQAHKLSQIVHGRTGDVDTALNSHKLVKGSDPAAFLAGEQSLLTDKPEFATLQLALNDAYGLEQEYLLPESFRPIVGDGDWCEGGVNAVGSFGILQANISDVVTLSGIKVGMSGDINYRHLPYQAWMTPHVALDALADGSKWVKQNLLHQVSQSDPSIKGYLGEKPNQNMSPTETLSNHLGIFKKQARTLLATQGVIRGRESPQVLKQHAQKQFDAGLNALKTTFQLTATECQGVTPDSQHLETLLARCWNRLSLKLAQISLLETNLDSKETLKTLGEDIANPKLTMAPTHLYHAASVQMNTLSTRIRTTSSFNLTLPGISIGPPSTLNIGVASLGSLSATVLHDKIAQHPNSVQHDEFLTFDVSAQHLPGLGMMDGVARAMAKSLADRIQYGMDKKQMNQTEYAALVANIEASLISGFGSSPVSAGVSAAAGVSRQFEVFLHRADPSQPWQLCYFQASNIENHSYGVNAQTGIAVGLGGDVSLKAGVSTTNNVVSPPILGSAPYIHILQFPRLKNALQGDGQTLFDKINGCDVATMYLSNHAILDVLDNIVKLKSQPDSSVLGKLAGENCNTRQYQTFQKKCSLTIHNLQEARRATKNMDMQERLKYFSNNETGKALFQEYFESMLQFSEMKGRIALQTMEASVLDASGQKHPIKIPEASYL